MRTYIGFTSQILLIFLLNIEYKRSEQSVKLVWIWHDYDNTIN